MSRHFSFWIHTYTYLPQLFGEIKPSHNLYQNTKNTFVLHLRMFAGIEVIFVYVSILLRYLIVPCFDNSSLCVYVRSCGCWHKVILENHPIFDHLYIKTLTTYLALCKLLRSLNRYRLKNWSGNHILHPTVSFST